jgi:hypothetical protein
MYIAAGLVAFLSVIVILLMKKVYHLEAHMDAVLPRILEKIKYLENRQAPHTFNNTKPTQPGL